MSFIRFEIHSIFIELVKTERKVRFQSQQSISLLYILLPFLYTNVCCLVVKIIISVTNIRVGTNKIEIEIEIIE